MPKGYTTKEKIENYLLTEIGDSFNDQIDEWIEAVETYIDRFTNQPFLVGSDNDVPADIVLAATILAAGIVATSKSNEATATGDIQSITIGRYSVTYGSGSSGGNKTGGVDEGDILKATEIIKSYKVFKF